LNLLADAYVRLENFEEAESLLDQALEVDAKTETKWSRQRAETLGHLGQMMLKRGRLLQAEEYYRQAVQILELILPADDEALSIPFSSLGCILDDLGRKEESERL